jgi:16S rRNA (guanine966-N2)-methyltransferase
MRIIAGRHKGRVLAAPKGAKTRPTAARAREGLFNMLAHGGYGPGGTSAIAGAVVLDAFAGTGAFAFEALSRGAASATLLEIDARAVDAARDNALKLGEKDHTLIRRMDATRPRTAATTHGLVGAQGAGGQGLDRNRRAGGRGSGGGRRIRPARGVRNRLRADLRRRPLRAYAL